GNHVAAGDVVTRALELAREAGDDLAIASSLNVRGLVAMREGAMDDALAWLRESLGRTTEGARDPVTARVRADTLENLGLVYRETGEPKQAHFAYREALEIREVAGDEAGIASCHNHLGNLHYRSGRFADATEHYRVALESRRKLGDRRGTASTANNLAGALLLLGKLRESAAYFEESRLLAEDLGDERRLASILSNMGLLRSYEGRGEDSERLHRESLRIHRERRDAAGQAHALNNLSALAFERGRPEEALRFADEGIELWRTAGRLGNVAKALENRGRALLELGHVEEARTAAIEALKSARQTESAEYRAEAGVLLARALAAGGEREAALASAEEAVEAADQAGSPSLRAMAATARGGLLLESGRLEDAKQDLARAERHARSLSHPWDRAVALAEQGRLLVRAGALDAAAERLRRAEKEFEALGNVRRRIPVLMDLAAAVAPADPDEAETLRVRGESLARAHDLADVLAATSDVGESPALDARRDARWIDRLDLLARDLHATGSRRQERNVLVDVDSLFRFLREGCGITRALLVLDGDRFAEVPPAGAGRFAVRLAEEPESQRARFVLSTGREPAPEDAGRLEVSMGSTGRVSARLVVGRNTPFDSEESHAITLGARIAALALLGAFHGVGRQAIDPDDPLERFEGLVGGSPAMRAVYRLIEQVAPSDSSVLLLGESGTGKELAARAIHARSPRCRGPFVAINCPSIPRELIEAELFGHEKGAFTGATVARPGKVELADGGTLFLDEVGDMAAATQVRLLRFLEEREFQRVGGRETRSVDVRILAATSRNLTEAIERGEFRGDLYYRLNVVPLRMPPLRERREDLEALCAHLLRRRKPEGAPIAIARRALDRLAAWDWPGNVRELRNVLEYMVTVSGGEMLDESHVPESVRFRGAEGAGRDGISSAAAATVAVAGLRAGETLEARLRDVEAGLIRSVLDAVDWNQSAAARRLGVTETKVRNRMRQYGIHRPRGSGGAR
ncbi:MAG: sigma 54-interacting transcriptional regulator, partial [Gemmatimonadetes bacterium]|nr:sigma 54-interacting transcriptional regulator [Gemmatimonadota bacterium]